MRLGLVIQIRYVLLGLIILLVVAGSAMAGSTNPSTQVASSVLNVGNTLNSPLELFYDNHQFGISVASANSIAPTISLGSVFGTHDLGFRLYKNKGPLGGKLVAKNFSGAGYGFNSTAVVIGPNTWNSGSYFPSGMKNFSGTSGGSYMGVLNISHVPEIAEWAMLFLGLSLLGIVAVRRKREMVMEYGAKEDSENRDGAKVIDTFIHAFSWSETLARITIWSKARESRYVCICNVHSVVTASRDMEFRQVVNQADMATPDGMPVAWMLRKQGFVAQERINGPDLMWKYCDQAERNGEIVYFYGSTNNTLNLLSEKLLTAFPALRIGGVYSPPFRTLSETEDDAIVASINASGAGVVFVGLGCPKQEKWMATHRNRIQAVMIGVGAAFDYHAGTVQRAPLWMQRNGLEWLHRLCSEPGRLWKRYFVTNTLFIIGAAWQLLRKSGGNTPKVSEPAFQ